MSLDDYVLLSRDEFKAVRVGDNLYVIVDQDMLSKGYMPCEVTRKIADYTIKVKTRFGPRTVEYMEGVLHKKTDQKD